MADTEAPLPSAEDFLLRSSLYEFYNFGTADEKTIQQILYFKGTLDAYCTNCKRHSIFERTTPSMTHGMPLMSELMKTRKYDVEFACSRQAAHTPWFHVSVRTFYRKKEGTDTYVPFPDIGKTGQWPTVADLHTADVGKYRKLLGTKYGELTRAIGLASHGVGIGSFVYLRRIFESLIEEAHAKAVAADPAFADDEFQRARMDEKIRCLSDYLPSFSLRIASSTPF